MGKELDRYQALALPGTRVLPIELARCTPRIGKSRLFFKRGKLVTIDWKQVFSYRNFLVSFLVDGQILLMTDFPREDSLDVASSDAIRTAMPPPPAP
jgi:hypothetical protein